MGTITKTQHALIFTKRWSLEALEEDDEIYINPSDENGFIQTKISPRSMSKIFLIWISSVEDFLVKIIQ